MAIKDNLAHWEAEDFGTELIEMTLGDLRIVAGDRRRL